MTDHATEAALYKTRWEEEQAHALDLARQVDQHRAANEDIVAKHNALVEEITRLRGGNDDELLTIEPTDPNPRPGDMPGETVEEKEN